MRGSKLAITIRQRIRLTGSEIAGGLDTFGQIFGNNPITMSNHYNAEAIYWGKDRVGGLRQALLSSGETRSQEVHFYGHVEPSEYFWGDLCQTRVKYCRNFTYDKTDIFSGRSLDAIP